MNLKESILSGILQGVTEFLPVSSSGHLVILNKLLGHAKSDVFFDICLHAGTLAAVLVYFSRDIWEILVRRNIRLIFYFVIATVPAVLAALLFEEKIDLFFDDGRKVGFMMLVTALVLFAGQASIMYRKNRSGETFWRAVFTGIAQAFALLPGLSRSACTVSAALVSGMERGKAFSFAFLLSVPAVAGAVLYKGLKNMDGISAFRVNASGYMIGTAAAFIVGLLSLPLLKKMINGGKLYVFGVYCLVVGTAVLMFLK